MANINNMVHPPNAYLGLCRKLKKPENKFKKLSADLIALISTALILALILSIYEGIIFVVGNRFIEYNFYNILFSFNQIYKNNLWLVSVLLIVNLVWLPLLTPIFARTQKINTKGTAYHFIKGLPLLALVLKYWRNQLIASGLPLASFVLGSSWNIELRPLTGIIAICIVIGAYLVLIKLFSSDKKGEGFYKAAKLNRLVPVLATSLVLFFILQYMQTNYQRQALKKFNVLLIVVDTLRADHLSCYGYYRRTSPNIDRLAIDGIRFSNTSSNSSHTIVSTPTIISSVYASQHKIKSYKDYFDDSFVTAAEVFLAAGYKTVGIVTNPHLTEHNGFHQGFQTYYSDKSWLNTAAEKVNQQLINWLKHNDNQRKFFAFLFYVDPHVPFQAPPPFNNKFSEDYAGKVISSPPTHYKYSPSQKEKISTYDAEICYFDYQLGKLMDELKEMGVYNNTLIIFTADHGEEFWEHGEFGHGQSLYEELLHVPLIIKPPLELSNEYLKYKHIEQDMVVSNVDILPSILGILDIQVTEEVQRQFAGKNIFRHSNDDEDKNDFYPFVFSEQILSQYGPYKLRGIRTKEWKYIITYENGKKPNAKFPTFELYNLEKDPGETKNLINQRPDIVKGLAALLNEQLEKINTGSFTPKQAKPNKVILDKLKSLGYIN